MGKVATAAKPAGQAAAALQLATSIHSLVGQAARIQSPTKGVKG